MERKTKIIFRADGNSTIGLGHIYRLVAFAEKLNSTFHKTFFLKESADFDLSIIRSVCDEICLLNKDFTLSQEISGWISELSGDEIVILDGYSFQGVYQKEIKKKNVVLVYLDDLHNHHQYADIVINVGTDDLNNKYPDIECYTRIFGGFEYAFLRNSFKDIAQKTLQEKQITEKGILICLGGADPINKIADVYSEVKKIFPNKQIQLVTGSAYQHVKTLQNQIAQDSYTTHHHQVNEEMMAHIMKDCEMAFCSASTVAYEYLTSGGLLFLYQTADNQTDLYAYLIKNKWAFPAEKMNDFPHLKPEWGSLKKGLQNFINTDYNQILSEFSVETRYILRRAHPEDVHLLYEWINEPLTRQQSIHSDPIPWENHQKWFENKLASSSDTILIMTEYEKPVGQIRFEIKENHVLISFMLDKNQRGKGLGKVLLKKGVQYFRFNIREDLTLIGYVKPENIASLKAFRKNRFNEEVDKINGINMVKFIL